jgi:transcription initiation factor IIE alpha subunit
MIAAILLVSAILLTINTLFKPQPIQIVLETGQAIATQSSSYFTITTVMILIICAFVIGSVVTYLFYNAETINSFTKTNSDDNARKSENTIGTNYDRIIPLLRDDEKKAVHLLKEKNGEILQNELVLKLGYSKVKTTRILASLERKQIIIKQRHGMTNSIRLK